MTLVLEFSPEIEARLRTNAAVRGQEVEDYLRTLAENDPVIDLTEFRGRNDFDESVAGIREGLADLDAGRTISFDEMFASLEEHIAARRNEERQQRQVIRTVKKAA
jgi:predicted transcriptional regulator